MLQLLLLSSVVLKFWCAQESLRALFKNQIPGLLPSEARRAREPRNLHFNMPCLILAQVGDRPLSEKEMHSFTTLQGKKNYMSIYLG